MMKQRAPLIKISLDPLTRGLEHFPGGRMEVEHTGGFLLAGTRLIARKKAGDISLFRVQIVFVFFFYDDDLCSMFCMFTSTRLRL